MFTYLEFLSNESKSIQSIVEVEFSSCGDGEKGRKWKLHSVKKEFEVVGRAGLLFVEFDDHKLKERGLNSVPHAL